MTTPWNQRYAQRMQWMSGSAIRELLKFTENPNIISFAGGMPAPELFPTAEFKAATDRVLSQRGHLALQYGATEGYRPLREWIVAYMARYGIEAAPENILITSGSQQALDMIGRVLINPGDLILTEAPTYLGALQAWRSYQAEFTSVPIDDDGLQVERLEEALCAGPKFMYILPNFQNPGGVTLSHDRRRKLIEFADRYGVPIIEDDPYGELRFEGEHERPLVVVDCERLERREARATGRAGDCKDKVHNGHCLMRGNVIYLSTFSKTLAPGLRLAWIVAPVEVIQRCIMAKQGMDLHTSSLVQMVAHELLMSEGADNAFLRRHVRTIRDAYRERRDVMLAMLERHFPPEVAWTRPQGGLFLWATLPVGLDATALLQEAIANNVAYVPGTAFYPYGRGGHNSFRLNFSYSRPELIEAGMKRLSEVVGRAMDRAEAEGRPELSPALA